MRSINSCACCFVAQDIRDIFEPHGIMSCLNTSVVEFVTFKDYALRYSIKSTNIHSISIGFHKWSDLFWEQRVAGSNPVAPTSKPCLWARAWSEWRPRTASVSIGRAAGGGVSRPVSALACSPEPETSRAAVEARRNSRLFIGTMIPVSSPCQPSGSHAA